MRQFCRPWVAVLLVAGWAGQVSAQPTIVIDYSLDANNFFPVGSTQRNTLASAAAALSSRLTDTLTAIAPSGGNTWTASFPNPATGATVNLTDQTIATNVIRVYAGGRELGGTTLGVGGPGGFGASGNSQAFFDSLGRGQYDIFSAANTRTDFASWGGAITFDAVGTNWNFALTNPTAGQNDFYSVALHELGHLLGFGTADSFQNLVPVGTTFLGPASTLLNGGVNPQVTGDLGHWASGTTYLGQQVAMSPSITTGTRKVFTELDFAGLKDMGWQVTPVPEPTSVLGLAVAGLAAWRVRRRC